MTRRICAYVHNGKYYLSQEFNGDREEGIQFLGGSLVEGNWEDLISIFDGVDSLETFEAAVIELEKAFHYGQEPLEVEDAIPCCEELWLVKNGFLTLYAVYGDVVVGDDE